MRLAGAFLVLMALGGSARAQGRVLRARSGAEIPVPPGFETLDRGELFIDNPAAGQALEAAYQKTAGEAEVTMLVLHLQMDNVYRELSRLPAKSGPLPRRFADEIAGSILESSWKMRQNGVATPLLYDDARKAFGIELRSRAQSLAQLMLSRGDDSAEWREVTKSGADPALFRCLLRSISVAFEEGSPHRGPADAARDCSVTKEVAADYIKEVGPAFFERRQVIERLLHVLTSHGATLVKVEAEAASLPVLEEAWKVLWTGIQVPPDVRLSAGLGRRLALLRGRPANLLGEVTGSLTIVFLLGVAATLGLWKLRTPLPIAAVVGQGLVLGLILTFSASDTEDGALTARGLIRIVVSLMALPITFLVVLQYSRRAAAKRAAATPPSEG